MYLSHQPPVELVVDDLEKTFNFSLPLRLRYRFSKRENKLNISENMLILKMLTTTQQTQA